jgi:hypothetical protein
MRTSFWLRVNDRGKVAISKGPPKKDLSREIAFKLNLQIPDGLFKKPHLEATMAIPETAVQKDVLNAQVTESIAQAIKSSTGLEMVVKIVEPDLKDRILDEMVKP